FTRSAGVWTQQAYLKASNTGANDQFGWSVAVAGDTVVVGAYLESSAATGVGGNQGDNTASGAGAAYVFTRSAGVWTQQAYLKASNTGASDRFGWSVAIAGNTVVVGAYWEDSAATGVNGTQGDTIPDAGAAYVFTRSAGVWTQQAYLKASNTGAFDFFGYSVAVAGDTVVVGASEEDSAATGVGGTQADNTATQAGAAYVFTRSAGVWTQQAYLKASNTGTNDQFGWSVAVAGDTVVVGAYLEDSAATGVNGTQANNSALEAGAAYVFLAPCVWQATLTPPNQVVGAGASATSVTVTVPSGCAWTAVSAVPWVTITSGTPGTGSGPLAYSVAANVGPNPRRGTLTIAGKPFIVSQMTPVPPPCTITIPTGPTVSSSASAGNTFLITASTGSCRWAVKSHVAWLTVTSAASGVGGSTVTYAVAQNTTGLTRRGRITVNGKRFTVTQTP
ncbi:MAG: hypothetical protein HOP18_24570, partial [Deltaproteobacteria bacterium]|nr:hypothetical protein [Deltaproteobacteria bacterium]